MMELPTVGNWARDTKATLQYLLIMILVSPACLQDVVEEKDYCQWETFEAKCPPDSVIVMTSAIYGRMAYGRCVKRDYGYVGCYEDVLHLADARCSGTHQCNITIPDKVFDKAIAKKCPEDLRRYLRASYTCRKVVSPSRQSCTGSDFARPLQTSGLLASAVTEETGCGTAETPWLLEVPPGQRVSLTLHDFGVGTRPNVSDKHDVTVGAPRTHCHVYAIIKEQHPARSTTICSGSDRMKRIYESSSNSVEVRILGTTANRNARKFLLEYKAQGCPDVPSPPGGWVERKDNTVIIGCNGPVKTWRLTCNDTKWIGIMTNCTSGDTSALLLGTLPHASSVFIVVVVATIVGLVVLIIGLLCLKRVHKRRKPRRMTTNTIICKGSNSHPMKDDRLAGPGGYSLAKQQPLLAYNDPIKIEENEYAYVEDVLPFDTLKSTCDNTLNRMKQNKIDYNFARDTGHYTARPSATGDIHGFHTMASRHKDSPDIAPQYFVLDCKTGNPEHTCVAKDTVTCEMQGIPHGPHRQISFHRDDPRFVPVKR